MSNDTIEQYLQADVPLRVLLEHGAQRLDWLTNLETSPIVLSYRDAAGKIVNEQVTKFGLIERAHALGWKPVPPGEAEKVVFEDGYLWVDNANEHGTVAGIWFSQEHATHWEEDAWGTPLGIPAERFAAIEQRDRSKREDAERVRAEIELRGQLQRVARTCFGFIQDRIKGRLERDNTLLTCDQAWDEVLAIADVHGADLYTEQSFPPLPWSQEQRQELRSVFHFCNDVAEGCPINECIPDSQMRKESSARERTIEAAGDSQPTQEEEA